MFLLLLNIETSFLWLQFKFWRVLKNDLLTDWLTYNYWVIFPNTLTASQELEPFPEVDTFDAIRKFHQELCKDYSPRDHLLKVGSLYIINLDQFPDNLFIILSPFIIKFFLLFSTIAFFSVCEEILLPSSKIPSVQVLEFSTLFSMQILY